MDFLEVDSGTFTSVQYNSRVFDIHFGLRFIGVLSYPLSVRSFHHQACR
jgi:hypothetical protein